MIKKSLDRKEEFNDRKAEREWAHEEEEENDPFAQYYD
jgi:hypothetical protein